MRGFDGELGNASLRAGPNVLVVSRVWALVAREAKKVLLAESYRCAWFSLALLETQHVEANSDWPKSHCSQRMWSSKSSRRASCKTLFPCLPVLLPTYPPSPPFPPPLPQRFCSTTTHVPHPIPKPRTQQRALVFEVARIRRSAMKASSLFSISLNLKPEISNLKSHTSKPKHGRAGIKDSCPVLQGALYSSVSPDDCMWTIDRKVRNKVCGAWNSGSRVWASADWCACMRFSIRWGLGVLKD